MKLPGVPIYYRLTDLLCFAISQVALPMEFWALTPVRSGLPAQRIYINLAKIAHLLALPLEIL